jgi:pyruvate formate-lyase activating enzyme-like uncharacterized protein
MVQQPIMSEQTAEKLIERMLPVKDKITGISISGGEVFYKNFEITSYLIKRIRETFPQVYLWAYTNGIAATEDTMKELRDAGLDELRFNLAATDFKQSIIDTIRNHAVKIFPWISVETPIYDISFDYYVNKGKLKEIADIGVKQVNLAEVRVPLPEEYNEDDISPAAKNFLNNEKLYLFDKMDVKVLSVVKSRLYTYDVFEYVDKENLDIRINDCSQDTKALQISKRIARGLNDISKDVDAFDKC